MDPAPTQALTSKANLNRAPDNTNSSNSPTDKLPGNSFDYSLIPNDESVEPTEPIPETNTSNNDLDWPIALRKGIRTCTKHPLHLFLSNSRLLSPHKTFLTSLHTIPIPKTFSEAIGNENWKNAIEVEMAAQEKNKNWEPVQLSGGLQMGLYSKI